MVVAGSSNGGKVATTSTDDDEEYFEPSKNGLCKTGVGHANPNDFYY